MSKKDQNINEALLWQYLEGDVSTAQKVAVEAWLEESAENKKQFDDTKKLFELTQIKVDEASFDADVAWNKVASKISTSKKNESTEDEKIIPLNQPKTSHKTLWWAAAAFIGILLTVNVLNNLFTPDWVTITAENQVKEITLDDGTVVSLKPGGELKYLENFNKKSREVKLSGDAFFDVAKNKQLPFSIEANDVNVTVLGTEFLVIQSAGEATEVVVQEGKVKMEPKTNNEKDAKGEPEKEESTAVVPEAGDKGIFNRAEKKLLKEINNDPNYLAWKTKILQFNKADLQEVIKKIEEVYEVKITFSKQEIQQCALTARFDNQSIDEIMQTLSLTLNLQIEKDGKVYTLDGEGC